MITYVNTVLVANKGNGLATHVEGSFTKSDVTGDAGKVAFMNLDLLNATENSLDATKVDLAEVYEVPGSGIVKKFKIGVVTDQYTTKMINGNEYYIPIVKWSNEIHTADIKHISTLSHPGDERAEDKVIIDFSENFISDDLQERGGVPIIVRLTFKDMPTRYRQWSESYDYYTRPNDSAATIAAAFVDIINKQSRRARVQATVGQSSDNVKLILTALPYDDNDSADSENVNAKVRFNATAWYSDPLLPGFASSNKWGIGKITKVNGWEYAASAKNIRDHERTAQGYQGILNRTEWYDVKPAMAVNMGYKYGAATIEFENMYRAADDIFRKTKQTVELYASNAGIAVAPTSIGNGLISAIEGWIENLATGSSSNNSSSYADQPDVLATA